VDVLTVTAPNSTSATRTFEATVTTSRLTAAASQGPEAGRAPVEPAAPAGASADYNLWETHLFYADGRDMDTAVCQDFVDGWDQDSDFFALHLPLATEMISTTGGTALPIAIRGTGEPSLSIVDLTTSGTVVSAPLTLDIARSESLVNGIEDDPDYAWAALAVSPTASLACPTGLDLADGDWSIAVGADLDYGPGTAPHQDLVIEYYTCYEGEERPAFMPEDWPTVPGTSDGYNQGWGVTCLGPQPNRLKGSEPFDPQFWLRDTSSGVLTPTERITVSHRIFNFSGTDPVTVSFSVSSTLGIPWGIYAGDASGPTLPLAPIAGGIRLEDEFSVPNNQATVWLIADVPEGAQGAETVILTATDVGDPPKTTWASDVYWVGPWIAPAPAPTSAAARDHAIYLPSVIRQQNSVSAPPTAR
jgi:hypothetical protein